MASSSTQRSLLEIPRVNGESAHQRLDNVPSTQDFSGLTFTGPRGGILSGWNQPELLQVFQGVVYARSILYDLNTPVKMVLREGQSGLKGPVGGKRRKGETPMACALREGGEESDILKFPSLKLLTILIQRGEGEWVKIKDWESWGYKVGNRETHKDEVLIAQPRTAIFVAPLSEPFGRREVEGRTDELIDVSRPGMMGNIRPAFRHLLTLWCERIRTPGSIPGVITSCA